MNTRQFLKVSLLGAGAAALCSRAHALEFYPSPSAKKWAVLYGTWCGSSRDAGVWISEGMNGIAQVFDVRENPDLSSYDHIVAGGAIRSGKVSAELQDYLRKHQAMLAPKIRGLFAVCGNGMQPPGTAQVKALIDQHLAALCGISGVPSRVFLGRITYGLMDEASRKTIEGFGMPEYDNLKRADCMAFGKEILNKSV
jgi:menaquinone-dependent protoporphyrinogen IX oxidase